MKSHKSLFLTLFLSLTILLGFYEIKAGDINEFNEVTKTGDVYFTNYKTSGDESPNITIADLKEKIDDEEELYIIDWRKPDDYKQAHITDAVNMSIKKLISNWDQLPNDKLIINVCYTGQTASHATAVMNLAGLEARNLLFGMCSITDNPEIINKTDKWVKEKKDIYLKELEKKSNEKTETYDFPKLNTGNENAVEIIKSRFDTYINKEIVEETKKSWAIFGDYDDLFSNPDDYFIVNYWAKEKYLNAGHIPTAYCFPPKASLKTTEDLKYLPTDDDTKIIVYCFTGQTSSQVTAYLRILGYNSWSLSFGINGFATSAMPKYKAPKDADTEEYMEIVTLSEKK